VGCDEWGGCGYQDESNDDDQAKHSRFIAQQALQPF